jgi:hypothetical protein
VIIYKEKQSDDDDAEIIVKIFVEFTVGTGKIAKRLGTEHFYNFYFTLLQELKQRGTP